MELDAESVAKPSEEHIEEQLDNVDEKELMTNSTNSEKMRKSVPSKKQQKKKQDNEKRNKTTEGLPRTKCPDCGITITMKGLGRHQREKHSANPKQFPCNLCSHSSKRHDHLMEHQRRVHFEPIQLVKERGRSKIKQEGGEKRKRSPFNAKEFKKRHATTIQNHINMEKKIESVKAEMGARIDGMESLLREKTADVETTKIRLSILEQKQPKQKRPDLKDIDGLLQFIGLDSNATKNDIRKAISIRILEVSSESLVTSAANKDMTEEERDEECSFLNRASSVLQKWVENR